MELAAISDCRLDRQLCRKWTGMKAAAYDGAGAGVHVFSDYGCFARGICDHCVLHIGTVQVQAGEVGWVQGMSSSPVAFFIL